MSQELNTLVDRAARDGWFLPPIDPKEFSELVEARKKEIQSISEVQQQRASQWYGFEIKPTDWSIIGFGLGNSWIYQNAFVLREGVAFYGTWGQSNNYHNLRSFRRDSFKSTSLPNPGYLKDWNPERTRFVKPLRYSESDGDLFYQWSECHTETGFWNDFKKAELGGWSGDRYFLSPIPKAIERAFWKLFEQSSRQWCQIEHCAKDKTPAWKRIFEIDESQRRYVEAQESRERKYAESIARQSKQKLSRIRGRQIRINPMEIITAAKTLNAYATQNH